MRGQIKPPYSLYRKRGKYGKETDSQLCGETTI